MSGGKKMDKLLLWFRRYLTLRNEHLNVHVDIADMMEHMVARTDEDIRPKDVFNALSAY